MLVRPAKKTEEEFENGTVAKLLGESFAQIGGYPRINGPADYSEVDAAVAKAKCFEQGCLQRFFSCGDCNQIGGSREDTGRNRQRWMQWQRLLRMQWVPLFTKTPINTKVDAAIAKVNALNKDEYKDFTAVEAAVNAVVRDKNITEQSEVDAMAKAIEDAICCPAIQGC